MYVSIGKPICYYLPSGVKGPPPRSSPPSPLRSLTGDLVTYIDEPSGMSCSLHFPGHLFKLGDQWFAQPR